MPDRSGTGVGSRREDRETALGILYAAEHADHDLITELENQALTPEAFTEDLVRGVAQYQDEIDELINQFSQGWHIDRMPAVDRALLRMAVYEITHRPDVPTQAILTEVVELASDYSTEKSSRFVNGVISGIAQEKRRES